MSENWRKLTLSALTLLLGVALVFLCSLLLRFLYKPWVILIVSLLGFLLVGAVIKRTEAKTG
jgi:hypothetical protein